MPSLGPKATRCFVFSGLKMLLCMLSVFHSVLASGPARTVQFDSELSSSLGKQIVDSCVASSIGADTRHGDQEDTVFCSRAMGSHFLSAASVCFVWESSKVLGSHWNKVCHPGVMHLVFQVTV